MLLKRETMKFTTENMYEKYAVQILNWEYELPYDFYNSSASPEGMKELLENNYVAVLDSSSELAGFFCFGDAAQVPTGRKFNAYPDGYLDVGLGLKPALTGNGIGSPFLQHILNHLKQEFPGAPFRLTVAAFNERAIRLYKNKGFRETVRFIRGPIEYIVMKKECSK